MEDITTIDDRYLVIDSLHSVVEVHLDRQRRLPYHRHRPLYCRRQARYWQLPLPYDRS
jgi:hypothetical protein